MAPGWQCKLLVQKTPKWDKFVVPKEVVGEENIKTALMLVFLGFELSCKLVVERNDFRTDDDCPEDIKKEADPFAILSNGIYKYCSRATFRRGEKDFHKINVEDPEEEVFSVWAPPCLCEILFNEPGKSVLRDRFLKQ